MMLMDKLLFLSNWENWILNIYIIYLLLIMDTAKGATLAFVVRTSRLGSVVEMTPEGGILIFDLKVFHFSVS